MLTALSRLARGRAALALLEAAATASARRGGGGGGGGVATAGRAVAAWGRPFAAKPHKGDRGKHGGKKGAPAADAAPAGGGDGAGVDYDALKSRLDAALDHLRRALASLRTGRAAPSLLEHVPVRGAASAGGHAPPLKAVAAITARDAATLIVTPYDSASVALVAAAVRDSPLGLNPAVDGGEIVVPVPRPTKEGAAAMTKIARAEAEAARVSLRSARRDGNAQAKRVASTDARRAEERRVGAAVEAAEKEVGALLAAKEKDLSAV